MHNNRKMSIFIFICLILFCLVLRFFFLQVIDRDRLTKAASAQRVMNSIIQSPRGSILDRDGIPFTDRKKKVLIIIKPLYLRGREEDIERICSIVGEDSDKIRRLIEIKNEPLVIESDEEKKNKILSERIQGVSAVNYLERYDDGSLAKHILGYLNNTDKTGQSGVEKFYESALESDGKSTVGVITDAKSNPLAGLGYRLMENVKKESKLNLKLTLNYHIQKIVEDVMGKNNVKGAVVVEDVNTGDIVAMASKPDFDQNDVSKFLNSPGKELFNKAVAEYNMGSIFKIIDSAEALESGLALKPYYFCSGSVKIGNGEFKCHKVGGHGWEDITRAFSVSCNSYFIDLGIRLGHERIIEMAKKFGLGNMTGIKDQGVDEASGRLPDTSKVFLKGDTANMSIGQGEVMVTPLQVADIVATVSNGGIKNKVNIVDSIIDNNGNKVREIRIDKGERIISEDTADFIKAMMEEVITSGTGTKANMDEYGGAGGKTGSAETGQLISGQNVVQAWFAGFFPKSDPKYSIAVFVENGKVGNEAAAPIFREIAVEIMKKGY